MQKLNMGCGFKPLPGYLNVDKYKECHPDQVVDLEILPWPWKDGTFDEIHAHHCLEHLGQTTKKFLGIIKEIYRVLVPDGTFHVTVPHPRGDEFLGDPTHVRPITANGLTLFSQKFNRHCIAKGWSGTTLGLYLNVDFDVIKTDYVLFKKWGEKFAAATTPEEKDVIKQAIEELSNVVSEHRIVLRKVSHDT